MFWPAKLFPRGRKPRSKLIRFHSSWSTRLKHTSPISRTDDFAILRCAPKACRSKAVFNGLIARLRSPDTSFFRVRSTIRGERADENVNRDCSFRDNLYRLTLTSLTDLEHASWPASQDKVKTCQVKGQSEKDCHNYVKVLVSNGKSLFTCGTYAFSPWCTWREVRPEKGICPRSLLDFILILLAPICANDGSVHLLSLAQLSIENVSRAFTTAIVLKKRERGGENNFCY